LDIGFSPPATSSHLTLLSFIIVWIGIARNRAVLSDNYFLDKVGRFAGIEEDELKLFPLWNELSRLGGSAA
jgi:hypothetical protein